MNDLIDSVLSMYLDVYKQNETQDADTGAIVPFEHPRIDCISL